MGRFCTYTDYDNVRQYAENELNYDGEFSKMLDRSVNGSYVFSLVHNLKTDVKFIYIDHVKKIGGEWGHRGYSESCGPYVYTCPERLLKQSTDQAVGAIQWRDTCRKMRKTRKLMVNLFKDLTYGTELTNLNGDKLIFVGQYRNSPTQIICDNLAKNSRYRYSIESFNYEKLVAELGLENKLAA